MATEFETKIAELKKFSAEFGRIEAQQSISQLHSGGGQ
jgi:hypothetical protein